MFNQIIKRGSHRALLVAAAFGLLIAASASTNTYISKAQKKLAQPAILSGTITGRVFRDFNGNGTYETGGGTTAQPLAVDSGVAGVTIAAYDSNGNISGTAVSAGDGTFSLAASGAGPYRLEYTTIPTGYFPAARSTNSAVGGSATDAGSTIQFVADGNTANVNVALNRPSDYCQDNPDICAQMYGVGVGSIPNAVFAVPYWAGSTRVTGGLPAADFQSPAKTALANSNQVGTTFGLAYKRSTRRVYAAAYMKKHAKLGPGGPGAIYQIDRAASTVSEFVNLNTIFGAGTAGTDPHNTSDYNTDNGQATWAAVGKIGFGGIAISSDEQFLFAMNLADRQLYRIPTSGTLDSTTIQRVAFPTTMPNCPTAGDVRPFAVTWHEGFVYIGAVCSQESSVAAISTDLRGYVYRFDPTAMTFNAAPEFNFRLDYTRLETDPGLSAAWRNWRSTYTTISGSHFIYPQPMLTDVEFDRGNLILSIRDRNGDQSGYNNASNPNNSSQLFKGITAGDILRACGTPATGWTLESNGRCGGGSGPQNTNEGPGGGEFYYQDNYHPNGNPHDEVGLGAAAQIPGHNVLVAAVFDPAYLPTDNIYDSAGFRWFDNASGAQNRGFIAYTAGDFGKANGLGNVQPLCAAAPIEIGNRVWRDLNSNGVQDPQESRAALVPVLMSGITVRLYDAGGNLIATALTDQDGEYYFSSATGTSTGNTIYNLALTPNTTYQVRFDNPSNYQTGGPLAGLTATFRNQSLQLGDDDSSDSDTSNVTNPPGSPSGIFPVITLTTGPAGSNNHTFDVGFRAGTTAADISVTGRISTADGRGIRNVRLTLTLEDGTVMQTLTGSFGYYRFDGIPAGRAGVLQINSKRFRFEPSAVWLDVGDSLTNVDFVAAD